MATIWKFTKSLVILLIVVLLLWIIMANYSVIFSKTVKGEIVAVEKNEVPVALMARATGDMGRLLLFSIAIRGEDGEIHTAASEERQWAVVRKGQCAEAVFLPYPPWDLKKKDTFFGARLVKLYDCPGGIPQTFEEHSQPETGVTE